MPFDLADVLAPDHTAVITVEIERGVARKETVRS